MKKTSEIKKLGYRIVKVHDCGEFGNEFDYYKVQKKFLWFWTDFIFGEIFFSIKQAENFIKQREFKKTQEVVKEI